MTPSFPQMSISGDQSESQKASYDSASEVLFCHMSIGITLSLLRFPVGGYLIRCGYREMWFIRGPSLETNSPRGGVQNGPEVGWNKVVGWPSHTHEH